MTSIWKFPATYEPEEIDQMYVNLLAMSERIHRTTMPHLRNLGKQMRQNAGRSRKKKPLKPFKPKTTVLHKMVDWRSP